MTTPSPLWFIDRSAGEVTLLLMTGAMVVGTLRAALPSTSPAVFEGIHTNLALLTVAFAAVHIVASLLDPYAQLRVIDVLVPLASAYRPVWLGLGVVAAYLYVAAVATSWPARRWRRNPWLWLHRTMYVAWVVALLHSLGTGSDARNGLFLVLNVAAVAGALTVFIGIRILEAWPTSPKRSAVLAGLAIAVVVGLSLWAATGPLQAGWAKASGTPPELLRSR